MRKVGRKILNNLIQSGHSYGYCRLVAVISTTAKSRYVCVHAFLGGRSPKSVSHFWATRVSTHVLYIASILHLRGCARVKSTYIAACRCIHMYAMCSIVQCSPGILAPEPRLATWKADIATANETYGSHEENSEFKQSWS